jgi:tetratricopeptide (TPR) repeat protein/tRNA A-37 threonylcarbamoyl transferase component Bud32
MDAVGDAARLEIAWLDLGVPGKADDSAEIAAAIARESPRDSLLNARARHVLGMARSRLGDLEGARLALLEANDIYREAGCSIGQADTRDALGSVLADCGRAEEAIQHFALAIAWKSAIGDREGVVGLLGRLGRAQLRSGRVEAAIECLTAEREIVARAEDPRRMARVLNDLGKAHHAMGDLVSASRELTLALDMARRGGHAEIEFLALRNLTLVLIDEGRLNAAEETLKQARQTLPPSAERFLIAQWEVARGTWLRAKGDREAVSVLQSALGTFEAIGFREGQLKCLVALARAELTFGLVEDAQRHVSQGLSLARSTSLHRFVLKLTALMFELSERSNPADGAIEGVAGLSPTSPGRFIIRGRLGSGTYGQVFRVYDSFLLTEAALKIVRLSHVHDSALRRRLVASARRELRVGLKLSHPGLAKVLEVGELDNDDTYVLQELIVGQPLSSLMVPCSNGSGCKADLREGLSLLARVAWALDTLHGAGIVHRDVKPANIMVRLNGTPVLVDFGVAQTPVPEHVVNEAILGTVAYMSPEQAQGGPVDGRSDLYSLGVVAYEWFAGRRPIEPAGASFLEQAKSIARLMPPRLRTVRPDVPEALDALIAQALAKAAKSRPRSAAEFALALETIASRL